MQAVPQGGLRGQLVSRGPLLTTLLLAAGRRREDPGGERRRPVLFRQYGFLGLGFVLWVSTTARLLQAGLRPGVTYCASLCGTSKGPEIGEEPCGAVRGGGGTDQQAQAVQVRLDVVGVFRRNPPELLQF